MLEENQHTAIYPKQGLLPRYRIISWRKVRNPTIIDNSICRLICQFVIRCFFNFFLPSLFFVLTFQSLTEFKATTGVARESLHLTTVCLSWPSGVLVLLLAWTKNRGFGSNLALNAPMMRDPPGLSWFYFFIFRRRTWVSPQAVYTWSCVFSHRDLFYACWPAAYQAGATSMRGGGEG